MTFLIEQNVPPIYNSIGKNYDATGKADPIIVSQLCDLLGIPSQREKFLDLGCGTGNYTIALHSLGYEIAGADLSQEMLTKAQTKAPEVPFFLIDAHDMSYLKNENYDGITCVLATHHMGELKPVFQEAYRLLKKDGVFILFTSTPTQMAGYWLNHYFPTLVKKSARYFKEFEELRTLFHSAHFSTVEKIPFSIREHQEDFFLMAGKYRPEIYLDETVRSGISLFSMAKNNKEITDGLENLKSDIISKKIATVINSYENNLGEYCFVLARK